MKIPDTFVLVLGTSTGIKPLLKIDTTVREGSCVLACSAPIRQALGFPSDSKNKRGTPDLYFQVYLSSQSIRLVQCKSDAPGAKKMSKDGRISQSGVADMLDLRSGLRFECKAEVILDKSPIEVWATYPKELREHIEVLNGVSR